MNRTDIILFFLQIYNNITEIYTYYTTKIYKLYSIWCTFMKYNNTYYFKNDIEYQLPYEAYDMTMNSAGIWEFSVRDDSHSEWNEVGAEYRGKYKIIQWLAGELYINETTKYEIPGALLYIKSSAKKSEKKWPTYEQWLQVIYNETGNWSLITPAKIVIINDMGEECIIKSADDFKKLIEGI